MLKANIVKILTKYCSFTKSPNSKEETSVTLFILRCFVLLQFYLAVVVAIIKSSIIQSPHSHSSLQWDKLLKFCQFMNCLVNFLYPSLTEISFPTARHFTLTFSIFPLRTKFYWESQITQVFVPALYVWLVEARELTYLEVGCRLRIRSATCWLVKEITEHIEEEKYG